MKHILHSSSFRFLQNKNIARALTSTHSLTSTPTVDENRGFRSKKLHTAYIEYINVRSGEGWGYCSTENLRQWHNSILITSNVIIINVINVSPRKLAEIASNQRNALTNSKAEHAASLVYCNVVESSNTSEISAAWITFDATEMRCINWVLHCHISPLQAIFRRSPGAVYPA